MGGSAFHYVRMRSELDSIPTRRLVECATAGCVDGDKSLDDGTDPHAWAHEHLSRHPGHDRYRIRSMTPFRVVPADEEAP